MLAFTKKEKMLIKKLNTPAKVQTFLNDLKFNFEKNGETIKSPIMTMRRKNAHCMEGALLGAYILSMHKFEVYLLCLKVKKGDYDHVITPFRINGLWGALSKTNHAVLRYREPVYKNIRELVMSYFHEYFLNDGEKTLRKYSDLLPLKNIKGDWATSNENLWYIDDQLEYMKYHDIIPKSHLKKLRKADKIERKAGMLTDFRK